MMYPHVFQPGRIGTLELESRLVFPPMQTRATDERGFPTKRLADFLVRRAHGMGLMIVQHSFCWEGSGIERGMDISLDRSIPYLEKLVRAVKATGTKVGIQIGGRTLRQKGNVCYAPSSIPISFEERFPTEISKEQICGYLEAYARSAARIRAAGFDVIELHGLTGKLLAQFLSPYFNRRSDEYGGSLENRTRFPREVMEAIHSAAGKDFPIIFGLTVDEGLEGGVTPQDAAGQARLLEQGGAAAFFISTGTQEKRWYAGAMFCHDSLDRLELGLGLRAATSLPIMVDGKIRSLEMGDQIIASGAADFIGICRPVMADPDFVEKSMRPDGAREIRRCLYCSNCMTWPNRPYVREFGTCCTVNPATFREASFEPVPAQKVKKVAVIGGGLAGMNAAQTLAQRGHEVTLYEQAGDLGGQWLVASHGADKADFRTLIPYLTRRMREYGVRVELGRSISPQDIRDMEVDCIVLATGALPRQYRGERPEKDGPRIVQGNDIIMGREQAGRRVLVVGARYIGMEVAIQLSDGERTVSLIDINGIGAGTIAELGEWYRTRLIECGVHMYPHTPLMRLTREGADIAFESSMISLPVDTVVLAIGTVPCNGLEHAVVEKGVEYYCIGDCGGIGDALKAMRDGAEVGRLV